MANVFAHLAGWVCLVGSITPPACNSHVSLTTLHSVNTLHGRELKWSKMMTGARIHLEIWQWLRDHGLKSWPNLWLVLELIVRSLRSRMGLCYCPGTTMTMTTMAATPKSCSFAHWRRPFLLSVIFMFSFYYIHIVNVHCTSTLMCYSMSKIWTIQHKTEYY